MKKVIIVISLVLMIITLSACSSIPDGTETTSTATNEASQTASESTTKKPQATEMKVNIRINGKTFSATLEDNEAAKELYEIIKNDGLTIGMSDYSGFEKVGALGHTLTSNDKQTTTEAGDIVLYQSNQIVMFYGSNSWSYTKLGKIDDLSGWEEALGSGDITAEFSVR